MELGLAAGALAVAILALLQGMQQRAVTERLRADLDRARTELHHLRQVAMGLEDARRALAGLDETRRAVEDLKQAQARLETAASAPPPLPRGRHADLDDLREQLRAAHRESAESESSEPAKD